VVLPFRDASGAEAPRVVREMVAERPRVAIVAYCRAGAQYSTDIRALAAAGVHQFVFAGIDDAGVAFRAVLDAARHQCAAEWVMCRLAPIVPATLHPMMEVALAKPETITTVAALASALGVVRGTVFNRCAHAWSVPPEEFLMWVRLALVAHFAETTGCTIETIAIQMAYPSVTALRNMMKRYTGLTTTEIRASGGLCSVVDALAGRLDVGTTRRRGLHLR